MNEIKWIFFFGNKLAFCAFFFCSTTLGICTYDRNAYGNTKEMRKRNSRKRAVECVFGQWINIYTRFVERLSIQCYKREFNLHNFWLSAIRMFLCQIVIMTCLRAKLQTRDTIHHRAKGENFTSNNDERRVFHKAWDFVTNYSPRFRPSAVCSSESCKSLGIR